MNKGELDFCIRRATNIFDKWNDITGFVDPFSSYYFELLACIEDAVHCGVQGKEIKLLDSEKD